MTGTAARARLTTAEWLARAAAIVARTEAFIDGRFVPAASRETFDDAAGRDGYTVLKTTWMDLSGD